AMVISATSAVGATVRFVPPDVFTRDPGLRRSLTVRAGTEDLTEPGSLLVSAAMAASLGVAPGDVVTILTTFAENLAGPPRLTPVRIAGVYETGYQELDAALAYAPLALGDRILSPRASRALVGVKVRDPFGDLRPIEQAIMMVTGGDTRVADWREIEYARLAGFRTTKALLLFIMALVVIVAAVNVSSSVLMILFERRHDLGILKSVGAGPGALSVSFLWAGVCTGALGVIAGIGAGLLVAVNINEVIAGLTWVVNRCLDAASLVRASFVPGSPRFGSFTLFNSAYYLTRIPIRINATEVAAAGAATILLSAVASYLPAARAARTRPLDVLRKV
ncbi:MAG TPA: FtsX-like permease family protein, partial [Spirochaetia bacterium]